MTSGSLNAISEPDGHPHALSGRPSGLRSSDSLDGHEAVADDYFSTPLGEAELVDFLAADLDPVSADPVFREDLREQCWGLVKDGVTNRPKDH